MVTCEKQGRYLCSTGIPDESGECNSNYTAKDIKILTEEEKNSRFEWAHIGSLADKYKKDPAWIESGFRACQHVGVSVDYFVERYLEKTGVPFREDVDEAYRELFLRKARK